MNIRKLLPGVIIAIICTAMIVVSRPITASREYVKGIESRRTEIDYYMKQDPESPIARDQRAGFIGLNYYPVDSEYRVSGTIRHFDGDEIIEVPLTSGTYERYIRYGEVELNDHTNLLEVWKPLSGTADNRLFVAFTDGTSGDTTYGGGRYLNLFLEDDDTMVIDFNLAYNPYCVYDYSYACPLPPLENRLSIDVLAGEKNYP